MWKWFFWGEMRGLRTRGSKFDKAVTEHWASLSFFCDNGSRVDFKADRNNGLFERISKRDG